MRKPRKILSPDGLWQSVFQFFQKQSALLSGNKKKSSSNIVDCLMACCAIFSFKLPSLLQYDINRSNTALSKNIKKLFRVQSPPSDTTVRERLDELEPDSIRGVFKMMFSQIQRGKGLEQYKYWDDHYLMSVDATGHFSSKDVFCDNCCVKNHKSGDKTYHHNMLSAVLVHPDIKRVIPFAPEAISKTDGDTKNDCEQNAATRLLLDFRREHPHLKVIASEDSLYSTGPHIKLLRDLDIRFIISAKPGNLSALFEWIKVLPMKTDSYYDEEGYLHEYTFINNVPLNDSNFDEKVNFLAYTETSKNGRKKSFSWITDIPLSKETVELVMRGGRARWRIENETFNTLKNQGYNFEHNFGHGKENLCSIMAMLMMLAFMVDQVSELFDKLYQRARAKASTYYSLWEQMRTLIRFSVFSSWDELYGVIAQERKLILIDTS